jgi:tight adherence protein B
MGREAMTALASLCGACCGLGITLVVVAFVHRDEPVFHIERKSPRQWEHSTVRIALALGVGVLVGAVTRWPVAAVLGAAAGFGVPSLLEGSRAGKDAIARVEAVAAWAEMLRDTLAGAAGLEQAIVASAPVAPVAIRTEIVSCAAAIERDRLGSALRQLADDVRDPTMDLVVAALLLAAEHEAARLGDLLGRLAESARAQATMRLRVEAGRARSRTSVKLAVGMTVALSVFLSLVDDNYLSPFGSAVGQMVLAFVGVLFALAFVWLARISRPAQPSRLLREQSQLGNAVRS